MKVEFYKHNLGAEEKESVLECLNGIFLTTGDYVKKFEEEFAAYMGLQHAVGLTSCTAALHLSLLALDIGQGDEVITTPMTFIATSTAIIHTGAKPVFVDVEPESGLINPDLIESAITKKTKAILPVHLYGQMCDMRRLREIADKYGLKIIEDSAHCIEGERDGIRPGSLSDIACFSFYATKNITSGEGGAVATDNPQLAERVRMLRQHGMSKEAADRYSGHYKHWDMIECGWKYNMDNIQASLLLPQLKKIDQNWQGREKLYDRYREKISELSGIDLPKIHKNTKSAYHLFTIWVDPGKRDLVIYELGNMGIGVAVNYRAIHMLHYFVNRYGYSEKAYPISEKIGDSTISLPFYTKITDDEINFVLSALKSIL